MSRIAGLTAYAEKCQSQTLESSGCHELRETTYRASDGNEQSAQDVLGCLWILCDAHSNELCGSEHNRQQEHKNDGKNYKQPGYQY